MSRTPILSRLRWRLATSLAAASLLTPFALAGPATAAPSCSLTPVLRDVSVAQGLGSQPVLVRGKDALAKLYLSLPSCASTSSTIALTGASLAVTAGGATTTVQPFRPAPGTTPAPLLPRYAAAPALDAISDPTFSVPGAALAPTSTTARFSASFSVTVTWSAKSSSRATPVSGTTTFRTRPGSTTPITATVEKRTNALRVLLVPMGDATQSFATQYPESARAATLAGLQAVSRIMPVPGGVGDLADKGSTAGVRYSIAPTLLDLTGLLSGGKFCGSQTNFDAIKGQLGQFLLSWNTANPDTPADRVLGVVSDSISNGSSAGCADGMAAVNGQQGWVRAVPGTSTTPSPTGALMGMELGHTFGMVPTTRDAFADLYHSPYTAADTTAPDRAFNTSLRSFLADDKTVMTMSGTWNESVTLLEPEDWAGILCRLGGATTADCTQPGTVGTATGVGAEPTFVMSGTTDGHGEAGTSVVESYWSPSVPRTTPDPDSRYRLVQRDGGGAVLRDDGVVVTFAGTEHAHGPAGGEHPVGVFTLAVPFNTGADRVELWNGAPGSTGATLLYARDRSAPPVLTSTTVTTEPGTGGGTDPGTGTGGGTDPGTGGGTGGATTATTNQRVSQAGDVLGNGQTYVAGISGNGRFAVFTSASTNLLGQGVDTNGVADVFVRDLSSGAVERVNVSSDEEQANGATFNHPINPVSISDDGRYVAFESLASNLTADDTNGTGDVFVRDRTAGTTTRVSRPASGGDNVFLARQTRGAVISGDGSAVAFVSNRFDLVPGDNNNADDVFVRDLSPGGTLHRVSVSTPGGEANSGSWVPSLSDDGRYVAFSSFASNLVPDDTNGIPDVFVRDRLEGSTERVSVRSDGAQATGEYQGSALETSISDDGRLIGFSSTAANLVEGDTNGTWDAFVHDRTAYPTGSTTRVSTDSTGAQSPNGGYFPALSGDGTAVAFQGRGTLTGGTDRWLQYVRDLATGSLRLAITDPQGGEPGNDLGGTQLSDDGTTAVVTGFATDLVGDGQPHGLSHAYAAVHGGGTTPPANPPTDPPPPVDPPTDPPPPADPPPAGQEQVTVTATDDNPDEQRLDLLYRCPDGVASPVAVGLVPSAVTATGASWVTNFDPSLGCEGGSLVARVNDGFTAAEPVPADAAPVILAGPQSPVAAVGAAAPTVLQFDAIALDGSGRDPEDGPLTGDALAWSVAGPGGLARTGSGPHVDLLPPAGGWPAGEYTATLTATDSDGRTGTAAASFTVLTDADHDGLPVLADVAACGGAGADADPGNAWDDPDRDGVPSRDDYAVDGADGVCEARTGYDAQVALRSVTASAAVLEIRIPYRDLAAVTASSVTITDIAGESVTFRATAWSRSGTVGTARFDARPIAAFLASKGMTGSVPVTVTGSGAAASGPWSFSGLVSYPTRTR